MRKFFLGPLIALSLAAALPVAAQASCSRASVAGTNIALPAKGIDDTLLNAAILVEVNYHRCLNGLAPLQSARGMVSTAAKHSAWMAKAHKLTHDATSGARTLKKRLKSSGVRYSTGAENIAMMHYYQIERGVFMVRDEAQCLFTDTGGRQISMHSYQTLAQDVVTNWMGSPKHRHNMLLPQVTMVGSAARVDQSAPHCGQIYLTQIFAG